MSILRKETVMAAVLQTRIEQGEKERNWNHAMQVLEQAVSCGPKLVVLPEAFVSGVNFIILRQMAEPIPGPTVEKLSAAAARHSIYLAAGILELGKDGKVYDSAVLIGPGGELLGSYRRRFLWTGERNYIAAGEGPATISTPLGNIGLLVGYDLSFPEACSTFLQSDVDIAVCPASVFERLNFNATRLALARAMDHHCYFLYANAVGFHQFANMRYTGQSAICADPYFLQIQTSAAPHDGLGYVAQAADQPGSVIAELCLEDLRVARRSKLPFKVDASFTLEGARPPAAAAFPSFHQERRT